MYWWMMGRFIAFVACLLVTSSCGSSDDDEVTRGRCEELRDHLIDLRLASAQSTAVPAADTRPPIQVPSGPVKHDEHGRPQPAPLKPMALPPMSAPKIDLAAHRAAMKQAFGERFLSTCQQTMTSARLKCVLAATDNDKVTACSSSAPTQTAAN